MPLYFLTHQYAHAGGLTFVSGSRAQSIIQLT